MEQVVIQDVEVCSVNCYLSLHPAEETSMFRLQCSAEGNHHISATIDKVRDNKDCPNDGKFRSYVLADIFGAC